MHPSNGRTLTSKPSCVPDAVTVPAPPEAPLPPDLICPICLELFDDPVSWPAPQCIDVHHFCRSCLEKMCESAHINGSSQLCPMCRSPPSEPILEQLWNLSVDDALSSYLKKEYPKEYAASIARRNERHRQHAELPRTVMPIFPNFQSLLLGTVTSELRRGKVVQIVLSTPEHLLNLASALCNRDSQKRFGMLMEGERWGYVAGLVSPKKFSQGKSPKSVKEILAAMRISITLPIKISILLVDTFRLDGEPQEETVGTDVQVFLGKTMVPSKLRIGTLITSPIGNIKPFEVC